MTKTKLYKARVDRDLSQEQIADLVGMTQPIIAEGKWCYKNIKARMGITCKKI